MFDARTENKAHKMSVIVYYELYHKTLYTILFGCLFISNSRTYRKQSTPNCKKYKLYSSDFFMTNTICGFSFLKLWYPIYLE